jgi:hypothetical protein
LNAFICGLIDIHWGGVASLEDSVAMELLKQLIVQLLLFLQNAISD